MGWRGPLPFFLTAAVVLGSVWLLDRLVPPEMGRYERRSALVTAADGRPLRGFTTPSGTWRFGLRPDRVDPLFLRLLRAYEDRRFDLHPGVDPIAMLRAGGQWLWHGRAVSGASTLTMQTARLLNPAPRTLGSKLREMLRALQLEWRLSKETILSIYLTLAPYGGNLEGLRAATLAYLGKEPRHLTPGEAALLVVLPQAPSRLRPDRFPLAARRARDKILRRMEVLGVLSPRQVAEAMQEQVPRRRRAMPFHAPHLARRLHRTHPRRALVPTTLRYPLQLRMEALAKRSQAELDPRAGVALLVVENGGAEVIAYVGGGDFFATSRAGQVDMVRAVRSPGSTLKPMIYGMGFDDRILHPETLVADRPTRFGDYAPSNFRSVYHGEVSVREALRRSLNIPAVAVLQAVGPARLAERLHRAGVRLWLPGGDRAWSPAAGRIASPVGLPLALGGVGTTLEDLVRLYAALASGGMARPLRYQVGAFARAQGPAREPGVGDSASTGERLLSEAAAWQVARILQGVPRPPGMVRQSHAAGRSIAFKTGTSYGFRDAWALGFDADYTVGVWIGRPDGSPHPDHFGRNTAAPVLLQAFDLLPGSSAAAAVRPPEGVAEAWMAPPAEHLRRFPPPRPARGMSAGAPPEIRFPPDGATLEAVDGVLPLIAAGGIKPLRWLVNGHPLASSPVRRTASWPADGMGTARIAVLDALGRTARARVWLGRAPRPRIDATAASVVAPSSTGGEGADAVRGGAGWRLPGRSGSNADPEVSVPGDARAARRPD